MDDSFEKNEIMKKEGRELTRKEKTALYALVKYPDMNNTELSKKIKLPRPTISRIRCRFIREGFLRTVVVPDFKKLNCELMVMSHLVLNAKNSSTLKDTGFAFLKEDHSVFFMVAGEREVIVLNLYSNYTTYKTSYNKSRQFYIEKEYLKRSLNILFPIENIKLENMDFAPLVKSNFKIDTNIQ